MAYEIEKRKIAGVVFEANQAISGKGFNHGEVVIGLSELIGRQIADVASNKIQADELFQAAMKHMAATIQIGIEAKGGGRIITGV